jgi:hypothetical protein
VLEGLPFTSFGKSITYVGYVLLVGKVVGEVLLLKGVILIGDHCNSVRFRLVGKTADEGEVALD